MTTAGERLRNEGMARAEANAGRAWRQVADLVMRGLIATRKPFSANDFNTQMNQMSVEPRPAAVGALFGSYAKAGKIVRVGSTRAAKASSHARIYPTWVAAGAAELPTGPDIPMILIRIEQAIEQAKEPFAVAYPHGYTDGLLTARRIITEEINGKR